MTACPPPDRLHALLGDTLDPADRTDLDAHLAGCTVCQHTLDALTAGDLGTWRRLIRSGEPSGPFALASEPGFAFPDDEPPVAPAGYDLYEELGRGGMGVVYRARQRGLNRDVALKVLSQAAGANPAERERFRREAEAAARLRHPNVVPVYEVGEAAGRLFLALEYAPGGTLAARLGGDPQPARAAAELVETLARAMHAAHVQGVVHRDLKPANVLLAEDGTPKVADFGLARLADVSAGPTRTSEVLGTPSYMAPEQAASRHDAVGPATDVWALGAILYEALTGRPPFKAALPLLTLDQVVRHDPAPPGRLVPGVPRDLETICLKCLRKKPEERYGSALALADDLRRFLDGRPVVARPVGPLERAVRWAKANPLPAVLVGLVAAALTVGTAVSTALAWWAMDRSATAEQRGDDLAKANADLARRFDEARRALYASRTARVENALAADQRDEARALLAACPEDLRGWEWRHLARRLDGSRVTLVGDGQPVVAVAYSPDGRLLASGAADGTLRIRDAATHRVVATCRHAGPVNGVAFSPDSARVATACGDGVVRVWDAATGREVFACRAGPRDARAVAFAPDGKRLAGAGLGAVHVWDAADGRELAQVGGGMHVSGLDHGPAGRLVAVGLGGPARTWDGDGREGRLDLPAGASWHAVALDRDGRRVAVVGDRPDGRGVAWVGDLATGATAATFDVPGLGNGRVAFAGDRLATAGNDGAVHVWDAATGRAIETHRGHVLRVHALAASPDGRWLASAGTDGTVKLWADGPQHGVRVGDGEAFAFSPAGDAVVTGGRGSDVRVWDAATGREIVRCVGHAKSVSAVAFGPGLVAAAAGDGDAEVRVWDAATGAERGRLALPRVHVAALAFDRAGRLLVGVPGGVRAWAFAGGADEKLAVPGVPQVWGLAVASDGRVAIGTANRGLVVRSADGTTHDGEGEVRAVAFSADGRWLASAGDGVVRVEDAATGAERFALAVRGRPRTVSFSPDGTRLAADDATGVKVWELATGLVVLTLKEPGDVEGGLRVAWSPDGRRLAVCHPGVGVTVHDAGPG